MRKLERLCEGETFAYDKTLLTLHMRICMLRYIVML